jgi:hypothetical protein
MAEPTNISEAEKEKLKEIETLNKAIDNLKELKSQGNEALVYARTLIADNDYNYDERGYSEGNETLDKILIGTNDEINNYVKQNDIYEKYTNGDVRIETPLSTTIDIFIDGLEKQRDFTLGKIDEETACSRLTYELYAGTASYGPRDIDELFIRMGDAQNYSLVKNQMAAQTENLQYLKNQLKYTGFGEDEKLHKELENGVKFGKSNFSIVASKDNYSAFGNKTAFELEFNRSEKTDRIFFNKFYANIVNPKTAEPLLTHSFSASSGITAKEAVNLLEGRAVKTEFADKENPEIKHEAFIKLNLKEPKNQYGNYTLQVFNKNYGVDIDKIMEKSNLIFENAGQKELTKKSLEKGNITDVKFKLDGKEITGKTVLNPQYKMLNLYDENMNRLNTNKPLQGMENENNRDKNHTVQQKASRGI